MDWPIKKLSISVDLIHRPRTNWRFPGTLTTERRVAPKHKLSGGSMASGCRTELLPAPATTPDAETIPGGGSLNGGADRINRKPNLRGRPIFDIPRTAANAPTKKGCRPFSKFRLAVPGFFPLLKGAIERNRWRLPFFCDHFPKPRRGPGDNYGAAICLRGSEAGR